MSTLTTVYEQRPLPGEEIVYPESDGEPMAENTEQFEWIVTIQTNLDAWFSGDVFVAGDLFWYPVKGQPKIRVAPDTLVAFGRPKGHRGSYLQWREGGIAPQVVFEIWSPGNTALNKQEKFEFYELHGVEEYYTYNPDTYELEGWVRDSGLLLPVNMDGWVSPRLGMRFVEREDGEPALYLPDGRKFMTAVEAWQGVTAEQAAKEKALRQKQEALRQKQEALRQKQEALKQVARERAAKEAAYAKLRALGIDPESL